MGCSYTTAPCLHWPLIDSMPPSMQLLEEAERKEAVAILQHFHTFITGRKIRFAAEDLHPSSGTPVCGGKVHVVSE